jgi:hypothetical protein
MEQNSISNIKENNNMLHYNKLTSKRRAFIDQLYNLINTQFEEQEKLVKLKSLQDIKEQEKKIKLMIEELENNPDYIQRIFIDAPWGMGKTFFSKALMEKIEKENEAKEDERKINLININAWETDYFSDPMKSMVGEINSNIKLSSETTDKIEQILKKGLTIFAKSIFNKGLDKIGIDETKRKELETLFKEVTQFETSELEDYEKYKKLVDKFKECLSLEKDLKVIVIDELDRCKPIYAIELLETIKHFFGVKNIIFVFLVNKKQLQSIVSTSYLQDDECSEYFEKFFDIQFNLPELEYEDFIQIEYDKYNQPQTYGVNNENISEDNIRIYESIFLDAFSSNCDSSIVSPRNFIKSFKKFRILITSLSEEEKACYPLMIVLILYFIREEFLKKIKTINKSLNEENNLNIDVMLFKTFFLTFDNKKIESISNRILLGKKYSRSNYKVKEKYKDTWHIYVILANILYFKNSTSESTLIFKEIKDFQEFSFNILGVKVKFKKLECFIHFSSISDQNPEASIYINPNFFNKQQLVNYKIPNIYYNADILEAWAKEKYNFTMNIK